MRARAGAVDFVGHQDLSEDRARNEAERASIAGLVENFRPDDIGGHQIRGALDAAAVEAEHRAQGFDQPRLGQTRNAEQKKMSAREQGDQGLIDDMLLSEDDAADTGAHGRHLLANPFDIFEDGVVRCGVGIGTKEII